MQAASRESYRAAEERLETYARGADPSVVASIAAELLAVAGLLRREPRLRRALSEPSRSGADRTGLLQDMLRGKVSADALELLFDLAENPLFVFGERHHELLIISPTRRPSPGLGASSQNSMGETTRTGRC